MDLPFYQDVITEQNQAHATRAELYKDLEKEFGMPVVSFFTSFYHPVMIEDTDAAMIEGLLQRMDLSNGLALLINSPGGIGLAAERILNVCKSYSKTGEFIAVVPGKAKSAATMVCMGASKVLMSKTSELGPIDPQVRVNKDGNEMSVALCNLVASYEELFSDAAATKGNLQPFLQALANYDPRQIKEYKTAIELAEDVAIRALKAGMMSTSTASEIKKKIAVFLTPDKTKSHGRSIFHEEATSCGLNVELIDLDSELWRKSYELYVRLDNFTRNRAFKCIENCDQSFSAAIPHN